MGERRSIRQWILQHLKQKPSSLTLVHEPLAEKLLQSLETLSEAENEQLWAEEALRRHEELETDTAVARSTEEVFREARARLS
jgi:hypothetical protein